MIWGPFLLALALGLMVSAGLYFAYLWPQVEPEEPAATPSPAPEPTAADDGDKQAADHKEEPAPDDAAPEVPPPSKSA
ncbi:MAG TPA: hypothetical protein VIV11_04985 [Kofleriaceae bacterium]